MPPEGICRKTHHPEESFICKACILLYGWQDTEDKTDQHHHEPATRVTGQPDEYEQGTHNTGCVCNIHSSSQCLQLNQQHTVVSVQLTELHENKPLWDHKCIAASHAIVDVLVHSAMQFSHLSITVLWFPPTKKKFLAAKNGSQEFLTARITAL